MDDLTDSDTRLGKKLKTFTPSYANSIAGGILAVLVLIPIYFTARGIVMGVFYSPGPLPWYDDRKFSWFAAGALALLLLVLIGFFFIFAWLCKAIWNTRVHVCEYGIVEFVGIKRTEILFAEIVYAKETHLHERPPILKGPAKYILPKLTSVSYSVLDKQGTEIAFDESNLRRPQELANLIKEQSSEAFVWHVVDEYG